MIIVSGVIGILTMGLGALVTWPVCVLWAAMATRSYNRKLLAGQYCC
jgi:hypothetical protein